MAGSAVANAPSAPTERRTMAAGRVDLIVQPNAPHSHATLSVALC